MTLLPLASFGRGGICRPLLATAFLGFLLGGCPSAAFAQQELTLPELEGLYRGALAGYESAFEVLEVMERQFERASEEMTRAINAGEDDAMNRAYAETRQLSGRIWGQRRRVEETADSLTATRDRLLDATALYLEELLAQADTATNPVDERNLAAFVEDTGNRLAQLRGLEDPPVRLEPEPDINAEPRDSPAELRAKANILDLRALQYEEQHSYYDRMLAGLLRDQSLFRRSGDFLADRERFDNIPVPVGAPGSRITSAGQGQPSPGADSLGVEGGVLTLEQRIEALEALKEEITLRIETIRIRAETLRRLAGGVWA